MTAGPTVDEPVVVCGNLRRKWTLADLRGSKLGSSAEERTAKAREPAPPCREARAVAQSTMKSGSVCV